MSSRCNEVRIVGRQVLVDGQPVQLGARAFDVLGTLLRHPDEVVSKHDLLEAAWPGLVVEENNLQVQISNLRRVLGREAIATVPGQGYQLTLHPAAQVEAGMLRTPPAPAEEFSPTVPLPPQAPVETVAAPARAQRLRLAPGLGAASALLLLMAVALLLIWRAGLLPQASAGDAAGAPATASLDRSVAVLPFTDMSERKDLGYLSEGIAEEVLHLLSKVPELRVAARTSSFSFKDKSDDLPTIGRKLQVATVLEGSVRRSGDSLRITAELVRADNGFRLWSQTYDRRLSNIFEIQEEVAANVVQTLQVSLLGERLPTSMDKPRTEAYALYLQGRSLLMRASTQADFEEADEYARRAVSADVTYAPSWAFFSRVLSERAQLHWIGGAQGWEAARQAATRSLSIDPGLREGQLAIASIALRYDWNWSAAREQIDAVLRDEPGNAQALAWSGGLALALGQKDRAVADLERASTVDPLDPNHFVRLAEALYLKGRFADAQIVAHRALALHEGHALAHWVLGRIALANGDPATALDEFEREPHEPLRLVGRAVALHALGRDADSSLALRELEGRYAHRAPFDLALAHAALGQADHAFADLDSAYTQRDADCLGAGGEPLLANLRSDARYSAFLKKLGLPASAT